MFAVTHDYIRHDLWIAVAGGVVATLAWSVAAYLFHRGRMWLAFHDLDGTYEEKKKFVSEPTGKRLEIKVKGSQLRVRFIAGLREGETVEGQIAMDERTRNTGRGSTSRSHHRSKTGRIRDSSSVFGRSN